MEFYNDLRLYGDSSGGPDIHIEADGDVGIGTDTPGAKLDIVGNALITGNYLHVNSESAGRLRVGASWGMPGLYSGDDGAKDLVLGIPSEAKVNIGTSGNFMTVDGGGNVGIDGNLDVSGDFRLGSIIKSGYWSWAHSSGDSSNKWVKIGSFVLHGAYNNMGITWDIFPTNSNHGDSNERISVQFRNHSTAGPESTYSIEY